MRPVVLVLGGLTVLLSLGVAVVLYRAYGVGGLVYTPRGFAVSSDTSVQVVFSVDQDPGRTALCRVRARDIDGAETGAQDVRVGPATKRRVIVRYDLATRRRAVTGEVTACRAQPAATSGTRP